MPTWTRLYSSAVMLGTEVGAMSMPVPMGRMSRFTDDHSEKPCASKSSEFVEMRSSLSLISRRISSMAWQRGSSAWPSPSGQKEAQQRTHLLHLGKGCIIYPGQSFSVQTGQNAAGALATDDVHRVSDRRQTQCGCQTPCDTARRPTRRRRRSRDGPLSTGNLLVAGRGCVPLRLVEMLDA